MKLYSALLTFFFISTSLNSSEENTTYQEEALTPPLGLPAIVWPKENPYNRKKMELGRLLYYDKRLSSDGTISCASCHSVPHAFADRRNVSEGVLNRKGNRHAPTVINTAYVAPLFWDGRAKDLEEQVKGPISNPKEMTTSINADEAFKLCQKRIHGINGYHTLFKDVFGDDSCSIDHIAQAIATFERTVLSGNSPYDKYMAGDKSALTTEQIHGLQVFKKVGCANCHAGPNFTDGRFLNIGVGMDSKTPDLGRYEITKNPRDWGSFKIPTLREVEHSYPYMHDGSHKTLEEVVDYYDRGGNPNRNLSPLMKPLHLSEEDKRDLVSFMKALNGEGWEHLEDPKVFPN
jgi:cytochrome c peroxidase